jgi:acyl carrier protein
VTPGTPPIERVRGWLLGRRPDLEEIDFDMDLIENRVIENRVIDSLGFLDFVFFLEELTGRELQTDLQSVSSFRTLRAIQGNILGMGGDSGQIRV